MKKLLSILSKLVVVIVMIWLLVSYTQIIIHQTDGLDGKDEFQIPRWNCFYIFQTYSK